MLQAFQPQGLTQLIAATSSPQQGVNVPGGVIGARFLSDAAVYFAFSSSAGSSGISVNLPTTSTPGNGIPIAAGAPETFNISPSTNCWIAFMTTGGSANVKYTPGFGV